MSLWHSGAIHDHYMLLSIGVSVIFFVFVYIGYKILKKK